MNTKIEFTRVNNDTNGNPRYVCHFLNLLTTGEKNRDFSDQKDIFCISNKYNYALIRAKKIGGRKFHNKQYGGGIVFQSYNIEETEKAILALL
jgi:hypothetical protein